MYLSTVKTKNINVAENISRVKTYLNIMSEATVTVTETSTSTSTSKTINL